MFDGGSLVQGRALRRSRLGLVRFPRIDDMWIVHTVDLSLFCLGSGN